MSYSKQTPHVQHKGQTIINRFLIVKNVQGFIWNIKKNSGKNLCNCNFVSCWRMSKLSWKARWPINEPCACLTPLFFKSHYENIVFVATCPMQLNYN